MPGVITARWTATRGRLAIWAYTRNVASLPKRLTSLATVIALSGSPAVLSTCMALCLQDVPAMAHKHGASVEHAAQAQAATPVAVSGHSHHGSPTAPEARASANARVSAPKSSETHIGATCNNCCPDGVAVVAGPRVERTDAHAFGATPTLVQVAHFLVTTSALGVAPHGPPVSPPAPLTAPRILRI